MKNFIAFICSLLFFIQAQAQNINESKKIIDELCSTTYYGRGYVNKGAILASEYLANLCAKKKIKPYHQSYFQKYYFDINTHPYPIECKLDNKNLQVGKDFLLSPTATQCYGNFTLRYFDTRDSNDLYLLMRKAQMGFKQDEAIVLRMSGRKYKAYIDSFAYYGNTPALLILTEEKKLTHSLSTDTQKQQTLYIYDSVINQSEKIFVTYKNKWLTQNESRNVIAGIKGKKQDSIIVFSAHYDHLGMQGDAMFPGASDNASGSSMLFYLADYFQKNKPKYDIVFIFFSGEEAGLLGSEYFVSNPTFDIKKIKILINIDIMGSAENGITVVNGEVYPNYFKKLTAINDSKKYLPEVRIRGKARNSDHYHFSENDIPSFFIYSMGGPGYYHDIYDKAESLPLNNYEQVAALLIDFVNAINK